MGCRHEWKRPHAIVGGNVENPGVWSLGGGTYAYVDCCMRCGCGRHTHSSERDDRTEYVHGEFLTAVRRSKE